MHLELDGQVSVHDLNYWNFILKVEYSYMEIYLTSLIWFNCTFTGFSSQRTTPMIQFCSSVCVNHLKRCKTSTFFISRGQECHGKSPANEDTYHRRWYQTWPVWRTCAVVITCCSGFASIQIPLFCNQCVWMARGLVWEPSLDNFISFLFSISVWIGWVVGATQNDDASPLAMAMISP